MHLAEETVVVSILYPSDLQTAVGDDWIDMSDLHSLDIVLFKGSGTAGDDPEIHITQATDNSGSDEKGLDVSEYYLKQGTLATSSDGGTFTKTTVTASYVVSFDATSAEDQMIAVFHIEADMLDTNNSFTHVRASVPDVGSNAQYGCILGIGHPRYKGEEGPNVLD